MGTVGGERGRERARKKDGTGTKGENADVWFEPETEKTKGTMSRTRKCLVGRERHTARGQKAAGSFAPEENI